jgi:hypothetical protein
MTHAIVTTHHARISERPGRGRLGRHIEHDERSRGYAHTSTGPLVSRKWKRHCPAFNQGELGSCTGNAEGGLLMTEPFYKPGRVIGQEECVALYKRATRLDRIRGHFPPEDTGSSGLAVMKAAVELGYLTGYRHAFGLTDALHALTVGPVIAGIDWFSGFDTPKGKDSDTLEISGEVRGGHEVELLEIDVELMRVGGIQSWGEGFARRGYFYMSFATLATLLSRHGDVTVGIA